MQQVKRTFLYSFLLFGLTSFSAQAKNGYKIKLNFTDVKESTKIWLGHYHGKGGSVYRVDSVILIKGKGILQSKSEITGGIYALIFKDKTSMELILLNGDQFSIQTKKSDMSKSLVLKGNTENHIFQDYQKFLLQYSQEYSKLKSDYTQAKSKKDSATISNELNEKGKQLKEYRSSIIKKNPNTFPFGYIKCYRAKTIVGVV